MTKDSFAEECDINHIIAQFLHTGHLPEPRLKPHYINCIGFDYNDFMNFIADANELYDALPGAIKAKFGQDQQAFVAWATNPENAQELTKMGLVDPTAAQQGEARKGGGQKLPSDPNKDPAQTVESKGDKPK